jgi:hypothetical protein
MFRHTVSFSLRYLQGSAAEAEFLASSEQLLTAIPGVNDFVVRRQVSPKTSFDFQFAMTFDDAEAFEQYATHPSHVEYVEQRWVHEVAAFQELDFIEYQPEV